MPRTSGLWSPTSTAGSSATAHTSGSTIPAALIVHLRPDLLFLVSQQQFPGNPKPVPPAGSVPPAAALQLHAAFRPHVWLVEMETQTAAPSIPSTRPQPLHHAAA